MLQAAEPEVFSLPANAVLLCDVTLRDTLISVFFFDTDVAKALLFLQLSSKHFTYAPLHLFLLFSSQTQTNLQLLNPSLVRCTVGPPSLSVYQALIKTSSNIYPPASADSLQLRE